jgi:hypothetical protein
VLFLTKLPLLYPGGKNLVKGFFPEHLEKSPCWLAGGGIIKKYDSLERLEPAGVLRLPGPDYDRASARGGPILKG